MSGSISSLGSLSAVEVSDRRSGNSAGSVSTTTTSDHAVTTQRSGADKPPYTLNPLPRVDPDLGLTVLEFYNTQNELEYSVPSSRQLAAYQAAMQSGGTQTADASQTGASQAGTSLAGSAAKHIGSGSQAAG